MTAIRIVGATHLPVVTVEQMAEVDRIMIEDVGIALLQMMENAGRNIAELARSLLGGPLEGQRMAVLAGPGHNRGGGLVAARHLSNKGRTARPAGAGSGGRSLCRRYQRASGCL